MLLTLLIIIGLVIYFLTLMFKEDEYKINNDEELQLNIDLYNILYTCLEKAYYLSEDPTSLQKYMIFKREILISGNTFEELKNYNDSRGFNKYLDASSLAEYNSNQLMKDLSTIQRALHQSHDFQEFQDNIGKLSSSFKLLIGNDVSLDRIHKERRVVVNQLQQRMQN